MEVVYKVRWIKSVMGALMGTALFYVCEINRGETNEIILSSSYEFSIL